MRKAWKPWPYEHTTYLQELDKLGIRCREMMNRLNKRFGTAYTKDAIIGKRGRLGLHVSKKTQEERKAAEAEAKSHQKAKRAALSPAKPIQAAPAPKKKAKPKVPPKKHRRRTVVMVDEPHVVGIPLLLRKAGQCGWPINDGKPFLFCGMQTEERYCRHHRQRATGAKYKPRTRKAA